MILRHVVLENFGLYGGRVEFDLAPRARRGRSHPIILIGGRNGVGKTTLLEAVRLALYGRRALGARVAQVQYDEYLRGRIHRPAGTTMMPTGAAVGIEFDYAEDGVIHQYRVRRAWSARGRAVVESLVLEKDNALVTGMPREEWHLFLQDLIPPGVSQLFFFDGEKIQEIADGDHEEEHLATAVRGLLGVELIARLRTDLGLYLARQQSGQEEMLTARLESTVRDLGVLDEQIAALAEELAQLSSTRESQARAAEQTRRRFVAEGGDIAVQRTQIEGEAQEVARLIAKRLAELREHANGLLPFSVAPRLTRSFRKALREAAAFASTADRPQMVEALRNALKDWRRRTKAVEAPTRRATWESDHWTDLHTFLKHWAAASSGDAATLNRAVVPGRITDRDTLLARLDEAEVATRPRMEGLANELEALTARQRKLEAMLLRADRGQSHVLLDELAVAEQRVGATEATLRAREEELKRLRAQRAMLERERERILEQQTSRSSAEQRADLAVRASRALAQYERRLLDHKLSQLRGEFVRCYNRLARKGEVVADVRIDPESFAVTLIDRDGREMPKSELSAGEKQVYAIAILWALARTSGRALPMIIDTPLARLDSQHRANLVERYFPSASHQVIMLSTDTEVDAPLLRDLTPSISHAYHLEYDASEGRTVARSGYFWEPEDAAETRGEVVGALQ